MREQLQEAFIAAVKKAEETERLIEEAKKEADKAIGRAQKK